MVYGTSPNNLPDFTGTLQIENVDTEDVILACTLLKDKPSLFEIDVECDLLLSQMTSEDLFIKSTSYQSALTFCRSEGDNWKRQIRPCLFGTTTKGGTVTGSFLLSTKNSSQSCSNKSMRIRSSPPPPSKLSLLFRPTSVPFTNAKDPLRRSKSFNVEIQSVSISLTQDEEEEETKKLSTLFNFMKGKNKKQAQQQQQLQLQNQSHNQQEKEKEKEKCHSTSSHQQLIVSHHHNHKHNHQHHHQHHQSVPDVLSNHNSHAHPHPHLHHHRPPNSICSSNNITTISCGSTKNSSNGDNNGEVPYGTVLDDVTEEENIYAEISDALTLKLSLNPIHQMGLNFHHQLHRHQSASNMSSLLKGGGGSDGAFSGTLSGTFSSSNPSNREEDIYDSVF